MRWLVIPIDAHVSVAPLACPARPVLAVAHRILSWQWEFSISSLVFFLSFSKLLLLQSARESFSLALSCKPTPPRQIDIAVLWGYTLKSLNFRVLACWQHPAGLDDHLTCEPFSFTIFLLSPLFFPVVFIFLLLLVNPLD